MGVSAHSSRGTRKSESMDGLDQEASMQSAQNYGMQSPSTDYNKDGTEDGLDFDPSEPAPAENMLDP